MTLLEVRDLTVRYGPVVAVDGVNLDASPGAIVGLIGPNGAGKTTLIDALTGFIPSSGTVTFGGRSIGGLSPHQRARAGLGRTWQSIELFDDLTVNEIMRIAASAASSSRGRRNVAKNSGDTERILESLGLLEFADRLPRDLSNGQRKLVGLARSLASNPKAVLADEPAAGLDTSESKQLGARLRDLVKDELAVILIDHDMALVLAVCDFIYVINFGKVIASGTPEVIRTDEAVISAYLGGGNGTAIRESTGDSDHIDP
jgi:ABC-type branched-subunit amino acid transport system ATPase component